MRIGFIGGRGHHYLRGLLTDGDLGPVTVAVASDGREADLATALATTFRTLGGRREVEYFDSPTAMLDGFAPDLVSVGGMYGFNGELNAMLLARDVAIVSDKPAAATWAQLERLQQLIGEKPSRVLLTEFAFRSRREFRAARDCVLSGAIGDVVLVSGQKSYRWGQRPMWYADRTQYGGIVPWVASHTIDVVPFVTGLAMTRATGHGGNRSQPAYGAMEDHVAIVAELAGGATAVMHADFCRPVAAATHGDDRLRVVGSKGVVEVRDRVCRVTTVDREETDITGTVEALPMHRALLAAARGEDARLFSTAETLRTARAILHVRDAVDRGEWVDLG